MNTNSKNKIYLRLQTYVYHLLKSKKYIKLYKLLYVHKKFYYKKKELYIVINKRYTRYLKNIISKDYNFNDNFIDFKVFIERRGVYLWDNRMFYLFFNNNAMNNNNYTLSREDLSFFRDKKYKKEYWIIEYWNKTFFSEIWFFFKNIFFYKDIFPNKNLVFRVRNKVYYFNRKSFYQIKIILSNYK